MAVNLEVKIGSLTMRTPVTTGSGTFGFGSETKDLVDLSKLGAVCVKATTRERRLGNPPARMCETASGVLNAIGLQNGGIENYILEKLPYLRQFDVPIIVNVPGESPDDFAYVARRLTESGGADAIELNISCPNVSHGLDYATQPHLTAEVVAAVKAVTDLPIIAKLSPNVTDIRPIAKAAEDAGADAISLINTVIGTAIDARKRTFKLANKTGGLSGPAIKPIALLAVYRVAQTVNVPIIGMGGIMNATDAVEFLLAGATAVAAGTVNFVNPLAAIEIADGIADYLEKNGFTDVHELIGAVQ
ncbi:dihydroorotate dehydrogenase [Armatimonas rosea]|uniref:Dihydroorotate dehydrogenase n=1 Tax=Armatimonas rosea TaxID=685828 RepID=A0A7W9SVW9_ARMRO|nr:dihydroorotate dehydrogenase [Armatimonas rosea]MBB6052948.1 dihydroorotate dehydrogenase (NAD+) catalytic subunit [Armatimonas rosea]